MFNFDRVGRKIKALAKTIFWLQAIVDLIVGIILCLKYFDSAEEELVLITIAATFIVIIIDWIATWVLYGFGELIDKVCDIEEMYAKGLNNINTFTGTIQPEHHSASEVVQSTHKVNYLTPSAQQRLKDKDIEEQNRIRKIRNLRMKGLISEEEYQEMMSAR